MSYRTNVLTGESNIPLYQPELTDFGTLQYQYQQTGVLSVGKPTCGLPASKQPCLFELGLSPPSSNRRSWSHFQQLAYTSGCHRSAIFPLRTITGSGVPTNSLSVKVTEPSGATSKIPIFGTTPACFRHRVAGDYPVNSRVPLTKLGRLWTALPTSAGDICSRWNHFFHHCLA